MKNRDFRDPPENAGGRDVNAQAQLAQMAELRVECDGLRFRYNGYRYDRLADALAYARLMRSRPGTHDTAGTSPPRATEFAPPTADERTLMASLGIAVADGAYRFGDFRYERLSDAVNYAKLIRQRPIGERD
jgi:hypothetical protein